MNFSRQWRASSGQWNSEASIMTTRNFCGRTRREMLWQTGSGFAGLALTAMMDGDGFLKQPGSRRRWCDGVQKSAGPERAALRPEGEERDLSVHVRRPEPHRHVRLQADDVRHGRQDDRGQDVRPRRPHNQGRIVEPRWKFKQYGQCGKWVSDLFPHLGTCVDDIAFLHSMTADSPIHGSAMLMMNSGKSSAASLPRLVGQLRPRQRERKPAGLRRHARSSRRPDQRRQELVQRLHAGHVPGHGHAFRQGTRFST